MHQLPAASISPVYVTDKQRAGNVKSFISLTDTELHEYHQLNEKLLTIICARFRFDILHVNHLVYQPQAALRACYETKTPLIIYPHGSSIEYTIKQDDRFKQLALDALTACAGVIVGNNEVKNRILNLYPEHKEAIAKKTRVVGVGVDTSLFKPVKKSERKKSIEKLITVLNKPCGKTPALSEELRNRIDKQGLDVTRDYWDRYDHSKVDADFADHVRRIPWTDTILLFVGALTVGKGLQSLIVALPSILYQNPKTHLIIVGAGAYREVLEALVYAICSKKKNLLYNLCAKGRDLDRNEQTGPWEDVESYLADPKHSSFVLEHGAEIASHVHFLGRMDHAILKYLFPCADIAVFPSIVPEAYPLVLMESLSNGVLPVVSYFSGFKEGIDELESLLGESLTEKLKITQDTNRRISSIAYNINELIMNGRVHDNTHKLRIIAEENYDWKIKSSQMIKAYADLVTGMGTSPSPPSPSLL